MNASKGLQRVSAVFWGVVGLFFAAAIPAIPANGGEKLYALAALGCAYGLHWLTCWMISGFFGDGD